MKTVMTLNPTKWNHTFVKWKRVFGMRKKIKSVLCVMQLDSTKVLLRINSHHDDLSFYHAHLTSHTKKISAAVNCAILNWNSRKKRNVLHRLSIYAWKHNLWDLQTMAIIINTKSVVGCYDDAFSISLIDVITWKIIKGKREKNINFLWTTTVWQEAWEKERSKIASTIEQSKHETL